MNPEEKQEKLMEYLYGEMPVQEKLAFKQQIEEDPELSQELKSCLQLREIVQEHLPEHKAPTYLTKRILQEVGVRRPWYEFWNQEFWSRGFLRPALVGAFVLALTLGVMSQWGRWTHQPAIQTAEVEVVQPAPIPGNQRTTEISDHLLVNSTVNPRLQSPRGQYQTRWVAPGRSPMVSLAGYGKPMNIEPSAVAPQAEIQRLELEAERAVAQFIHQQALRMRAVGDFRGAAQGLAYLIKAYPFYPLKLHAMAQRVDALFQAGEVAVANEELKVLKELSPTLAYLIERRWGN